MNTAHIIIVIGIAFYLFACIAFIDIARKDFGSIGKKALWAFIAFLPFIGPVLYFALGYRTGKSPESANP
ncbi:MAG: hypothetical protein C4522_22030 [Desulfobacteraceae bacterium]|nr:MAG: hypothetical protein C4522_22030 [Desulfobacteraceae bacterium]